MELLIQDIEKIVLEKTGFQMKFEEKPITKFFNIDGFYRSNNEILNPLSVVADAVDTVAEVVIPEPVVVLPFTCDITLPSGMRVVDDEGVYNDLIDGVKNDVEACNKLYKLYPHFIFCQGEFLYMTTTQVC